MKIQFEVPDDYPMILLAVVALCFQCVLVSFFIVVPLRKKIFTPQVMEALAGDEHRKAYAGEKPPEMGFPDAGSGRFALSLDYKTWLEFNNGMRSHLNIVEQLPFIVTFVLVGGLIAPSAALYIAWFGVVARTCYILGYALFGPNARLIGAVAGNLPIYGLGFYSAYQLVKS